MTISIRRLMKNASNKVATGPAILTAERSSSAVASKTSKQQNIVVKGRSLDVASVSDQVKADNATRAVEEIRNRQEENPVGMETANGGLTGMTGGSVSKSAYASILEDYLHTDIDTVDAKQQGKSNNTPVHRVYRDMYYHDPICGMAVDLMSTMPYSDFVLNGAKDEKIYQKFDDSIHNMNIKSLLPILSSEYLVHGLFVATTIFDKNEGVYNGIVPQNIEYCLHFNSKVLTDKGWVKIGEIAEEYSSDVYPINYVINGKTYAGTAPFIVSKERKKTYRLNFSNGFELIATDNHPIQVMRSDPHAADWEIKNGRKKIPQWIKVRDIQVGDHVVVTDNYKTPHFKRNKSFYEALFIGILMGDGSTKKDCFGNELPYAINLYGDKAELLPFLRKAKVVKRSENIEGVVKVLFNHRAKELAARYKYVNKKSVEISNEIQFYGYLSGLINTDGWVTPTNFGLAGAEDYMAHVRELLVQYGYPYFSCNTKNPTGEEVDFYIKGEFKNSYVVNKPMEQISFQLTNRERLAKVLKLTSNKMEKLLFKNSTTEGKAKRKTPITKVTSKAYFGKSIVYDIKVPEVNRFVANSVVVHNCDVTPVPIFGRDPLINLRVGEAYKNLANSQDERMKEYTDLVKPEKDTLSPDPIDVLYIPRRGLLRDYRGVSIYRRILPSWLLERALFRGTLDQSMKRQRAITHLLAGDNEWTPTAEEMGELADMLVAADVDPVGAIFVTRTGVQVNDIRNANDLWKVTDLTDFFTQNKLRALGISESFLSGDASYNSLEQAMSVFVEQIRAFREMITYELFYDKTFPRISNEQGYMKRRYALDTSEDVIDPSQMELFGGQTYQWQDRSGPDRISREDRRNLFIPQVHWQKRLRPEADSEYLTILDTLQQHGVPIPLRMWAAAGGIDLSSILNQQKDDTDIRKQLKAWNAAIQPAAEGGEGAPEGGAGDSLDLSSLTRNMGLKRPKLAERFQNVDPESMGPRNIAGGKRHILSRKGAKIMEENINKQIAEVAASLNAKINRIETRIEEQVRDRNPPARKFYTD